MILANVRPAVPDVDRQTTARARNFGEQPDEHDKHRVVNGYLLRKTGIGSFRTVDILDIPGNVVTADVGGLGATGYSTAKYSAMFRHPWRPGADYVLPQAEDADVIRAPIATFGVDASLSGFPVISVQKANYSITGFSDTSADDSLNTPFGTLGGPPATPNGGFWRCQFQTAEQKYFTDLLEVGQQPDFPEHWISVLSGYGAGRTLLDLRIGPSFVDQLAPGYEFMPSSVGQSTFSGPRGGTFPMATACRRFVNGQDLLAVSIPVAKTEHPEFYWKYDTGVSALLTVLFVIADGVVAPFRHHLFRLQDLPSAMQIDPVPVGDGTPHVYNTANLQSVALTEDGDAVVHGCWITSKFSPTRCLDSSGNVVACSSPDAVEQVNAGHIPIYHYYKAVTTATSWSFTTLATKVLIKEDIDFDGWLALDDDKTTPSVAVPYYIASAAVTDAAGEEVVSAVAWCGNMDRSLSSFNNLTGPVTGRYYAADPVSLFVYLTAAFQPEAQVYQSYRAFLGDPANGFPLNFTPLRNGNNAAYDAKQMLFTGFDRVEYATKIRFLSIDMLTGTVTYDVLPPVTAGLDSYFVTPKVSHYQQRLYLDEDRTELATEFGGVVSFTQWTGTGFVPVAYVFRNADLGWETIPGVVASTELHYVGNGFFGQAGRLFVGGGF